MGVRVSHTTIIKVLIRVGVSSKDSDTSKLMCLSVGFSALRPREPGPQSLQAVGGRPRSVSCHVDLSHTAAYLIKASKTESASKMEVITFYNLSWK